MHSPIVNEKRETLGTIHAAQPAPIQHQGTLDFRIAM